MVNDNRQVEELLKKSAKQYRELKKQTEEFVQQLEINNYSKAKTYTENMMGLQDEASAVDEYLLPLLTEDLPSWGTHPLFIERLQCIQSILDMNDVLSPKIQSTMAVASSEMKKLSGGRTAVAGYASQEGKVKSLLGIMG